MKKPTNEKPFQGETTSPEIGSLAGRILKAGIHNEEVVEFGLGGGKTIRITGAQMKAMASSLVNQMANKPEKQKQEVQ
jgi:hypothetical protein